MNYRHGFHAGNFADVVKHLALIAAMRHLAVKPAPFVCIDSHAGCGVYDLFGGEAARTKEAEAGVLRLRGMADASPVLHSYLALAADAHAYPGSPAIFARLKRPQDRLVAVEKHPDAFAALVRTLTPFAHARAVAADGYAVLPSLLPPPERRGLVLIDPPFEAADEFRTCAAAFARAFVRFATGIYMLWFPIKVAGEGDRFCGEVLAAGVKKALRLDVSLTAAEAGKLAGAGLLIVNPPYGFAAEMRGCLDAVLPRLDATARMAWLAGEE